MIKMKLAIYLLVALVLVPIPSLSLQYKSIGLIGDAGVQHPIIDKLRSSLLDYGIKDLILLGDNIYDTSLSYDDVWHPWIKDGFRFKAVAIGNHMKSIEEETAYFKMPADFYSVEYQSAHFIILNSENSQNITEQMEFLDSKLSKKNLNKQIYLILHHPYVTVSNFHSWTERADFQNKLRPLLLKHASKLTAVFSGHDHLASFIDVNGLPLIVSGASFESRSTKKLDHQDQSFRVRERWQYKSGKYWVRLDIADGATAAWLHFVPFDGDSAEECRFRLFPKPYKMISSCNSKTSTTAEL